MASKKEIFINEVKAAIDGLGDTPEKYFSSDALDYWNGLQIGGGDGHPQFTENGKKILLYIQQNKDLYNNCFKAKDIGEGMGISSRTVSGAMRKLVNDKFVEKIGDSPSIYSLTTLGAETKIEVEEF